MSKKRSKNTEEKKTKKQLLAEMESVIRDLEGTQKSEGTVSEAETTENEDIKKLREIYEALSELDDYSESEDKTVEYETDSCDNLEF